MYNGNRNDTHFPNGELRCYILYITFFKRNKKALTRKQQKIEYTSFYQRGLNNDR